VSAEIKANSNLRWKLVANYGIHYVCDILVNNYPVSVCKEDSVTDHVDRKHGYMVMSYLTLLTMWQLQTKYYQICIEETFSQMLETIKFQNQDIFMMVFFDWVWIYPLSHVCFCFGSSELKHIPLKKGFINYSNSTTNF
jgi:hypothetical protein